MGYKRVVFLFVCVSISIGVFASESNIPPVAVVSSTPNQTWFYNLEDVLFSSGSSYDPDGYVNYTQFYINGVLQAGSSYTASFTRCFALDGSPSSGCYQLASGVTTVTVGFKVRDNSGDWSSLVTKTYTIQEHKGRKYFVKDHIGNVRATINRDGNVLGYDDYYPFGLEMPGRSNNTANPNNLYKFTGHERDDEADLTIDFMNARTYDPILGRMMQVDPKYELYHGWSPYHYTLNNPLLYTDPTGECVTPETAPICIAIAKSTAGAIATSATSVAVTAPTAVAGGLETAAAVTGAAIGHTLRSIFQGKSTDTQVEKEPDLQEALSGKTVVIGKVEDLSKEGAIQDGEVTLLDFLPDQGGPRENWEQNSSVLRTAIKMGSPIRDATTDPDTGELANNSGFLRAERNLLENQGYTYNEETRMWKPPVE